MAEGSGQSEGSGGVVSLMAARNIDYVALEGKYFENIAAEHSGAAYLLMEEGADNSCL